MLKKNKGFTLVELMIGVAALVVGFSLLAMLVAILAGIIMLLY